jgi:hypothetical protein
VAGGEVKQAEAAGESVLPRCGWIGFIRGKGIGKYESRGRARVGDDVDGLRTLATGFLKKANFGARKFFFHRLSFFVSRRGIV